MNAIRMPDLPGRLPLRALPAPLVAALLVFALAAGCGGAKSSQGSAATANPGSDAAATTPPVPAPPPIADSAANTSPAKPEVTGDQPGALIFAKRCALCHGAEGHGDGVASKGLNPKPRNFHDAAYMSTRTDAQLLEVIHKGKGVMPRWEGQLSDAEMKAVLAHIRSLGARP